MMLSYIFRLSNKRWSREKPYTKVDWVFRIPAVSIAISMICHAIIITIFLFRTPTPKDTEDLVSVKLIASDIFQSKLKKRNKNIEEQINNLEVIESVGSKGQAPKTLPISSSELNQRLDREITPERLINRRIKLIPLETKILHVKNEETKFTASPFSTATPKPISEVKETTEKTAAANNHIPNIKLLKSDDNLSRKVIKKIGLKSLTKNTNYLPHQEEKLAVTPLNHLKWTPTIKPKPPEIEWNTTKMSFSSSFKAFKSDISLDKEYLSASVHNSEAPPKKDVILNRIKPRISPTRDTKQILFITKISDHSLENKHFIKIEKSNKITLEKNQSINAKNIKNTTSRKQSKPKVSPSTIKSEINEELTKLITSEKRYADATPVTGNPKPLYPLRAINRRLQGRVILKVEVLPSGETGVLKTATSSGHWDLDQAAIKAVRQWHFNPAKFAGMAVVSYVQVPILFKLR